MMRLAPGGPFDLERPLPPEILAHVQRAYHLDQPLWRQYLTYLGGGARGGRGPSCRPKDFGGNGLRGEGAPASFRLGTLALLLAASLGILAGVIAALRQNTLPDYGVMSLAMVG